MASRTLKYTPAADAWRHEKEIHEGELGHHFGQPAVDEFTFVGTRYEVACLNCGKRLMVHGGWGGPGAFGPAAHVECPGAARG